MADEEKLDRVLKHLDSIHTRLDAMEAEHKKDRADAAEFKTRMDAWRKDAEEKEKTDKTRKDAEEKERADKARADAEEKERREKEEKEKADKARADAEEKERKEKEEKERADRARADAQPAWAKELTERLSAIETHVKDSGTEDRVKLSAIWNQDERLCQLFGDSAKGVGPEKWWPGESAVAYARRIAGKYQKHSAKWKDVDLTKITDEATFANVSAEIYNDAQSAAMSGAAAPAGRLQRVEVVDPYSHSRRIEWRGDDDGATWAPFCNPLKIGAFATPKKD